MSAFATRALAILLASLSSVGLAFGENAPPNPIPAWAAPHQAHKGIALGLYNQDPEADYGTDIEGIAATGATHISVIAVFFEETVHSTHIGARKGYSPSRATILRTLRQAKARGLVVTLFPIVHIEKRGPGEWRGKLDADWNLWFADYKVFIGDMARMAADEKADWLVVGTEYVTTETFRERWLDVISHVRTIYKGKLLYSANWDHFDPVAFWDAVDALGVTAYHKLTASNLDPSVEEMVRAWEPVKRRLRGFQKRANKPLIITEIGYPSLDGANAFPWDETRKVAVDVEEQRRCYEAFARAFAREPSIHGIYFWIWFGPGGPQDSGYSPHNKPAENVIRTFFQAATTQVVAE